MFAKTFNKMTPYFTNMKYIIIKILFKVIESSCSSRGIEIYLLFLK